MVRISTLRTVLPISNLVNCIAMQSCTQGFVKERQSSNISYALYARNDHIALYNIFEIMNSFHRITFGRSIIVEST